MNKLIHILCITFGIILAWQIMIVFFHLPDYIVPAPMQVMSTLITQHALILKHAYTTILEMLIGFSLGVLTGCTAGFLCLYSRRLGRWLLPVLIISQAIPTFAIAPLLVIWFGYGVTAKIVMTILMVIFPIASAFYDGLRQTNPGWLELAKTMNASYWRTFWFIRIRAALPSLASGLRIAATIAPMGAIIGEWVGSSSGLGYLILDANARLQIDMVFAVLIVIISLALALYFAVNKCMQKIVWWQ